MAKSRANTNSFHIPSIVLIQRASATLNFSWAIPNDEALEAIASFSPLVEIGAGGGYWAQQLRKQGAKVVAFDRHGCSTKRNHYVKKMHIHVRRGGPKVLRKREFRNHTLLLIWPPYDTSMARECLEHFRGRYLCYIGEGYGGCTGCDTFHDMLDNLFEEIQCISIPQWSGMHDRLYIFKRKSRKS
jgi:hypothetical protein